MINAIAAKQGMLNLKYVSSCFLTMIGIYQIMIKTEPATRLLCVIILTFTCWFMHRSVASGSFGRA